MNILYVIVHPGVVVQAALKGDEQAQEVVNKLKIIQSSNNMWLVLDDDIPSGNLHPAMPQPREDLEVLVCGGKGDFCVGFHQGMLLEMEYNAKIFSSATYS